VTARQGSTTGKSQKPTAKRKTAHESSSATETPSKRFVNNNNNNNSRISIPPSVVTSEAVNDCVLAMLRYELHLLVAGHYICFHSIVNMSNG